MERLIGHNFTNQIYASVAGKIVVLTVILETGSVLSTMWVIYPDGVGEEIFTVQEGWAKLEL